MRKTDTTGFARIAADATRTIYFLVVDFPDIVCRQKSVFARGRENVKIRATVATPERNAFMIPRRSKNNDRNNEASRLLVLHGCNKSRHVFVLHGTGTGAGMTAGEALKWAFVLFVAFGVIWLFLDGDNDEE